MTATGSIRKIILVTGASSGLGLAAAKALLDRGHIVYCVARRVEPMRALEALGGHVLAMDVTDDASVQAGVDALLKAEGRIDVVFNNAGFGSYGAIEAVPMADIRYQFDVNVFGVGRVLKAVLPAMRAARAGLIVNTASVVSHVPMPVLGWYAATKHALRAISDAARTEVEGFGIRIVTIEPGAVRTAFEDVALSGLDRITHADDYLPLVAGFRTAMREIYRDAPGSDSTVDAVVAAIEAAAPKRRYRTTLDSKILPRLRWLIGEKTFDRLLLWRLSRPAQR